mgnify:FL=1
MNSQEISNTLKGLSPAKRIKFLRQQILNKNQQQFCEDGIIRAGTLKSIEIERMKIGPKIAARLCHKFSLEGIICDAALFLEHDNCCELEIDHKKKELIGNSLDSLELMRKKITQLTPIQITHDDFSPFIPKDSVLLIREANPKDISGFKKTLCLIRGDKYSLYYLTLTSDDELYAEYKDKQTVFSLNLFDFCSVYIVEMIYLNNGTQ